MALKFNFKKPSIPSGIDHNSLLNKGIRTHEELDNAVNEIENARDGEVSLLQKLRNIVSSIITDHKSLSNIGTRTHDELDVIAEEIETARGTEASISDRFTAEESSISNLENNITTLSDEVSNTSSGLSNVESEISGAKGTYATLAEKLDSMKPKMNLSDLEDVNITPSPEQDGKAVIWSATEGKYVLGNAPGGGGGSAGGITKIVNGFTEGQTNVDVPFTFPLGNVLKVYRNGVLQSLGTEYVEISQTRISVINPCSTTDEFILSINGYDDTEIRDSMATLATADDNLLLQITQVNQSLMGYITAMEKSHLKMQFKYDIALNLVKNYCSDYFIDVLQDASNIESYENSAWDSVTESIK